MAKLVADRVEVSKDAQHGDWLVRIWVGDEVIRRHCAEPGNAGTDVLRASAIKTASDEGYEVDPANVTLI